MCRCADRRAAIGRLVSSVAKGDLENVNPLETVRFVARTMAQDARTIGSQRLAQARASLRR